MSKTRLDLLLVERGLADSRSLAQRFIMAGQVRVDGQVALKPSASVDVAARLTLDQPPPFVSRGGEKLQAALQEFGVTPQGRLCADVGASTGGFSDCLLQHGAARVYAIDVGQGILHWKLRQDPRVVVLERTNARYLERLPEPVTLVTIDASFISLKLLLPVVRAWFPPAAPIPSSFSLWPSTISPNPSSFSQGWEKEEGHGVHPLLVPQPGDVGWVLDEGSDLIALIKPQFEAGRQQVARGDGVIRDPAIHRQVLLDVLAFACQDGYTVRGLLRSPLLGPKGNSEFLAWLTYYMPTAREGPAPTAREGPAPTAREGIIDLTELVDRVIPPPQP